MDKFITIPLSQRSKSPDKFFAIVDPEDADLLSLSWTMVKKKQKRYAKHDITPKLGKRQTILMHRIILQRMLEDTPLEKWEQVDHIDGDGLNNRRENLRLATNAQNSANKGKASKNTTGFKGVFRTKNRPKPFRAQIKVNQKSIHLGLFDTAEQAHEAYKEAAKKYFGEFARFE